MDVDLGFFSTSLTLISHTILPLDRQSCPTQGEMLLNMGGVGVAVLLVVVIFSVVVPHCTGSCCTTGSSDIRSGSARCTGSCCTTGSSDVLSGSARCTGSC